jgi:hypothetical protein
MNKKIFAELLESVCEAKAIMRGERKPARVTRLEPKPKPGSFLGSGRGTAKMPADFDEPLDLEWEAMK